MTFNEKELKGFFVKKYFFDLKGRVQPYRAEKSPVCEKKSKIAHNLFMTKATDLKTIF